MYVRYASSDCSGSPFSSLQYTPGLCTLAAPGSFTLIGLYNPDAARALAAHSYGVYCGQSYDWLSRWDCDMCKILGPESGTGFVDRTVFYESSLNGFGYMGYHSDGGSVGRLGRFLDGSIVVVFRGTDDSYQYNVNDGRRSVNNVDFKTNLAFDLTSTSAYPYFNFGGASESVHSGFADKYNRIRTRTTFLAQFRVLYLAHRATLRRIYIVGHSQGGALATLAAMDLQHVMESDPNAYSVGRGKELLAVYTFGQPRVVNTAGAARLSSQLWNYYRVTRVNDLVTRLPSSPVHFVLPYCHGGVEVFYPFTDTASNFRILNRPRGVGSCASEDQSGTISGVQWTNVAASDTAHRNYFPFDGIRLLGSKCPAPVLNCGGPNRGEWQSALVDVVTIPARCICTRIQVNVNPFAHGGSNIITEYIGPTCNNRAVVYDVSGARIDTTCLVAVRLPPERAIPSNPAFTTVVYRTSSPIRLSLPLSFDGLLSAPCADPPVDNVRATEQFEQNLAAAVQVAGVTVQIRSFTAGSIVVDFTITQAFNRTECVPYFNISAAVDEFVFSGGGGDDTDAAVNMTALLELELANITFCSTGTGASPGGQSNITEVDDFGLVDPAIAFMNRTEVLFGNETIPVSEQTSTSSIVSGAD